MARKVGNQQMHFQFALWASSLGRMPTVHEVEGYFTVRRESAWRIHRNWMRAVQHHREITSPAATGTTRSKEQSNEQ